MAVKLKHAQKPRTIEDKVIDVFTIVVSVVVLVSCIYPIYYIVILSFNTGLDASRGGIYLWPREFTLENYQKVLSDATWLHALGISVLRTVIGTVITVLFTSLFGYTLAKEDLRFKRFYKVWLIIAMYFSGGMIPTYMVFKALHLTNSFWIYIVPSALDYFFVLLFVSYFQEQPKELRESAIIDGASEAKAYFRVIWPLSKPILATFTLFSAVNQWNSYFDAVIYVQNQNLKPLAKYLMEIINSSATSHLASPYGRSATYTTQSLQLAVMVISILPIIVVYPFVQKYFEQGMMLGAVKG